MKQMLVCPNCKEIDDGDDGHTWICSDCKVPLIPMGYTKEEWSKMTSDQRYAARENALKGITAMRQESSSNPVEQTEEPIVALQRDIHTIKNILAFYLIVSIIGAIVLAASVLPLIN
ncbi:MAG: hypothetical protein CVV64_22655 [Candidatus Wallbacteria bacterium HGW-Wallbacteria-1]|jgi:hypothetical protein|uniref:Uncharacterized protein n=1 Tax=Candidatus Wallbacteria bacterium HGW-Wallbacteria-1 TaxID=2013854 RepID=A0A2N1PFL7_9BACT|nr:MAG: hypothetical protein CVV64_22655 [Candidatus Wallbacteria bacterium HGW-Wallbacteria-1]